LKGFFLLGVLFPFPKNALADIVHGQLKRLKTKTAKQLELKEFRVKRSSDWTDEKKLCAVIIELENVVIQQVSMHVGPPVTDEKNSKVFLDRNKKIVSGARIEKGRWIVEKERKFFNAYTFLKDYFKKVKKETKPPIKKTLSKASILDEKELIKFYKQNKEFAEYLTIYLRGKEEFLDY